MSVDSIERGIVGRLERANNLHGAVKVIALPPVRSAVWRAPAIAILVAAAVYGQSTTTPARTASARAIDVAAWRTICNVTNRLIGAVGPRHTRPGR